MNNLINFTKSDVLGRKKQENSNNFLPIPFQTMKLDGQPSFMDANCSNTFMRKFGRQYVMRDSIYKNQQVVDLRSTNLNQENISHDRTAEVVSQCSWIKKELAETYTLFNISKEPEKYSKRSQKTLMESTWRQNQDAETNKNSTSSKRIRPLNLEGNQGNQIRSASMSFSEEQLKQKSIMGISIRQIPLEPSVVAAAVSKQKKYVPVLQYAFMRQERTLSTIIHKQKQNSISDSGKLTQQIVQQQAVIKDNNFIKGKLKVDNSLKKEQQISDILIGNSTSSSTPAPSFRFIKKREEDMVNKQHQQSQQLNEQKEMVTAPPITKNNNDQTSSQSLISVQGNAQSNSNHQEGNVQSLTNQQQASSLTQNLNLKSSKNNILQSTLKKKNKKQQYMMQEGQKDVLELLQLEEKNRELGFLSQSDELDSQQFLQKIDDTNGYMNDSCRNEKTIDIDDLSSGMEDRQIQQQPSKMIKDNFIHRKEKVEKQTLRPQEKGNSELEDNKEDSQINPSEIDSLNLSAKSFCIYDIDKNKQLLAVKSKKSREIASLTKIMTCNIICQAIQDKKITQTDIVRVSKAAASMIGTSADLRVGDTLSVWDLLHGLMLPSGNDAAFALAEFYGRILYFEDEETRKQLEVNPSSFENCKTRDAIKSFITEMNKTSKELGLSSTHYSNPHGLVNKANRSSAFDVCKLSSHCLNKHQLFQQIVRTKAYTCQIKTKKGLVRLGSWENTNKCLLRYSSVCEGLKTGVTCSAGPCLTTVWKAEGRRFIITILKCDTLEQRYSESHRLFAWVCEKLNLQISEEDKMSYAQVKQLFKKQSQELLLSQKEANHKNNNILNNNQSTNNTLSTSSLQTAKTTISQRIILTFETLQNQSSKFVPDQSQDKTPTTSSSLSN